MCSIKYIPFGSKGLVPNASMAVSKGLIDHLSVAACEWFLMFLMFIDAALAYLLTKFASYCELQTPCMFCSRLDHVFGNEKPGSYLSLFCNDHRAKVSYLVSCDLHDKLADAREMCDDCFMSITKGKVGVKGHQRSYLDKNFVRSPSSTGMCSCCKRQWKSQPRPIRLVQPGAVRLGLSKITVKPPLHRITGRGRFHRRNTFKRVRHRISGQSTPCHVENNINTDVDMDTLSDSGCAQLRSNSDSDSDSEFHFSKKRGSKDDYPIIHGTSSQNQDKTRAEHSHSVSYPELSHHHNEKLTGPAILASNDSTGHRPKELKHIEPHARAVSAPSAQQTDITPPEVSKDEKSTDGINDREVSTSSDKNDRYASPEELNHKELHARAVSAPSAPQQTDITPPEVSIDEKSTDGINDREVSTSSDKNDGYASPEELNLKELHARAVSAPSVPQKTDITPPEASKDKKSTDGTNHREVSTSSDKNDGYESPCGCSNSVTDIEVESDLDKLKRQVEYDRERLHLLHTELEEERNAAAIAADETMAMITRLQEEKAALHMEALQYLRMMDEQAEYDMEALDKANDLVAEKDKEIQDLEAELEYFRSRYEDELMMGTAMDEPENLQGGHTGNGRRYFNSSYDSNPVTPFKAPVIDLVEEKIYISQCLSDLERKFHQFSSQRTSIGKSNGNIHAERTTNETENHENLQADNRFQSDHSQYENSLSKHNGSSTSNGSKRGFSADGGEVDVGTLENEISDLNERLEALEADRDFLEHACNTLQANGGLEYIQEIANHLQDLRRIRFDRRCQSVA